jgi:hypothetical protein
MNNQAAGGIKINEYTIETEAKKNPKKPVDVKSPLQVDSTEQGKKIDEAKPQKRKIRRKK